MPIDPANGFAVTTEARTFDRIAELERRLAAQERDGISKHFIGEIAIHARPTTPAGWLAADGAAVSRTTYKALFDVLGDYYGAGDGSTTFNVPNLKGKVPVGIDTGQTEFDTRGETGGAKTHPLSTGEMPVHNHGVTDPGHGHSASGYRAGPNNNWYGAIEVYPGGPDTVGINNNTTGITINNAGSGTAHNNLQPYIALPIIIYTGPVSP